MRIDIITVLPEMLQGFVNESIMGRAQKKGLAEIHIHNLRDYTADKWKRVDDYPYGGKAGMVIQCQPLDACISALKKERHGMPAPAILSARLTGMRGSASQSPPFGGIAAHPPISAAAPDGAPSDTPKPPPKVRSGASR